MLYLFFILTIVGSLIVFLARNKKINRIIPLIFLAAEVSLSFYAYKHLNESDSMYFLYDSIGVLLTLVLSILSIAAFYYSDLYLKQNNFTVYEESVYYAALMMFIMAMVSSYFAENVALLWVSIEATTLFISILIFHKRSSHALEATWKYLFVSSVGLAIAFIGILFLSIIASDNGLNNLRFHDLTLLAQNMNATWLKIAFVLIVTGFSVKMSVFPLYAVAIDAKTVAASPVNALMSTALVNVGFIGIFRSYIIVSNSSVQQWAQHVLMIVGVLSILIAAMQLTRVKRLKRMYAFSSMEHMGIVILGLAVGGIGYYAAILHLIFHSFVKAGLFFQLGTIRKYFSSIWIKDSGDYFKMNPIGGLAFIFGTISILAIPPSGLFVSELLTFQAMFLNKNYFMAIFVLILLTIIIYLIAKNAFYLLFNDVSKESLEMNENIKPKPFETIPQFVLFGLAVYLGIHPPLFFTELINNAIILLN